MYFKEILELTTCRERNGKSNIFQAIECEVYPEVKAKVEALIMDYLAAELKLFVRSVDFKDFTKSIGEDVNTERSIATERHAEVAGDIGSFKEEFAAIKLDYVTAEKFQNKLKHYTPMGIFQKTERRFADFVTKRAFNDRCFELEDHQKRESKRLDENYFMRDEIETKFLEASLGAEQREASYCRAEAFDVFSEKAKSKFSKISDTLKAMTEDHQDDLKTMEKVQIDIRNSGKTKADKKELFKLSTQLTERYCLYDDLKDLHGKVMPAIK
jgi:hypothetical protein